MHPRHAGLALEPAQHADVGQLAVPGQVVTGLGLDGGGPGPQPPAHPLPHPVAQRPRVGAPGDGHGGRHAAAGPVDLRARRAVGPHGEFGPAVSGVHRVGVGVDQPGGDQAAAQVLHVVHVHDVVDDPGNALGQLGGGPDPGDPVAARHHGGVGQDLGSCPQAADVGQQAYQSPAIPPGTGDLMRHERSPAMPCTRWAAHGRWTSFACTARWAPVLVRWAVRVRSPTYRSRYAIAPLPPQTSLSAKCRTLSASPVSEHLSQRGKAGQT